MNELFKNGYYVGKTSEIIDNFEVFYKNINELIDISNKDNIFKYRFDLFLEDVKLPEEVPGGIGRIHIDEEFISERSEYVIKNNIRVFQRWGETPLVLNQITGLKNYFRSIVESCLVKIYPDLENNFHHTDSFTLFKNGDFIIPHNDGENMGRRCVILIYLSHKEHYNEGGGELVINSKNFKEEVVPINENFCILDFSCNNSNHSVNLVKNDFKRYTYIDFVYNKNEMEK